MDREWFSLARSNAKRFIIWSVAVAFAATAQMAWPAPSMAGDGTACKPTSVLYEIDHRDSRKLQKILGDASQIANSGFVLWRVEKAGVPASYLFGTIHVIDAQHQTLSRKALAAIDASTTIAIESAEQSRESFKRSMAQAGPLMVSTDRELGRMLTDDEMVVVEKALSNAGYPTQMALGLKAWAATMFLTDSPCQRALQERDLKSIDALVVERAKANGAEIVGLETMFEQYNSLAAIAPDVQVAWLKASIELYPRVDDVSVTIAELYRFRRVDAVWKLTQEMAPHSGLDNVTLTSLRAALVSQRNIRMRDRALPLLERGRAFIAIGAMHHIGDDGLVALLRDAGFTLTPIE
jgi:uncharacterized protein YbaP (TraB family)